MRQRGNYDVKSRKIALTTITHSHRERELGDIDTLAASISRDGLQQPLILHSDGVTLVSGLRRLHACLRAEMEEAQCLIPSDVVEASVALQKEALNSEESTTLSMKIEERMDLASPLHSMPTPSAGVAHSLYAADAIGVSNRAYWRIRAIRNKLTKDRSSASFSSTRYTKIYNLMLAAFDNPPAGWSSNQIVEHLHTLRNYGDIPDSIASITPGERTARSSESEAAESMPLPHATTIHRLQPEALGTSASSTHQMTRRIPEIGRAIASLSGVCAGISSITEVPSGTSGDIAYWNREIRDCRRIINNFHSLIREASNV
ncbi:ParB N-terminal domain-containing protein [Streptomyces sp. c-19]|uniref:ParB N-terminal domain-containing protein n=1 Tax=Streptomyces sp. c-19 TaxID=2789275 RepID=UPI00397F5E3C